MWGCWRVKNSPNTLLLGLKSPQKAEVCQHEWGCSNKDAKTSKFTHTHCSCKMICICCGNDKYQVYQAYPVITVKSHLFFEHVAKVCVLRWVFSLMFAFHTHWGVEYLQSEVIWGNYYSIFLNQQSLECWWNRICILSVRALWKWKCSVVESKQEQRRPRASPKWFQCWGQKAFARLYPLFPADHGTHPKQEEPPPKHCVTQWKTCM